MEHTKILNEAKTVVIKIGSSSIIDSTNGKTKDEWMGKLASQIAEMKKNGQNVVIVSSGAVGLGKGLLNVPLKGDIALETKQAAAAAGNPALATAYMNIFSPYKIPVGLVLLTPRDTNEPRRRYNIRLTINELLARGAVPIINENDTVTTYGIRYGDNDQLASFVCGAIGGDLVILLTDVDGLFTDNPTTNKAAKFIPVVKKVTEDILKLGGGAGSDVGTGGMATKLRSAEYATEKAGASLIIANSMGGGGDPLRALRSAKLQATLFTTSLTPAQAYLNAFDTQSKNLHTQITIPIARARELAAKPGNILPADIKTASGEKDRGEAAVLQTSEENSEILMNIGFVVLEHSLSEIREIQGLQNETDVAAKLGYKGRYAVVRQENIFLSDKFKDSERKKMEEEQSNSITSKL